MTTKPAATTTTTRTRKPQAAPVAPAADAPVADAPAPAAKPAPTKAPAKPAPAPKPEPVDTRPAIVVKALELRKECSGKLPPSLKAKTVKLTDDELLDAVRKLVAKHGIDNPVDMCHVLYWGVAGQRVALSNARVNKAWAALADPVPAPAAE